MSSRPKDPLTRSLPRPEVTHFAAGPTGRAGGWQRSAAGRRASPGALEDLQRPLRRLRALQCTKRRSRQQADADAPTVFSSRQSSHPLTGVPTVRPACRCTSRSAEPRTPSRRPRREEITNYAEDGGRSGGARSRESIQPGLGRSVVGPYPRGNADPVGGVGLALDVGEMVLDRASRQEQCCGDLRVGIAVRDQAGDLRFASA